MAKGAGPRVQGEGAGPRVQGEGRGGRVAAPTVEVLEARLEAQQRLARTTGWVRGVGEEGVREGRG